ncbi:MAG: leucine--tRNA ligase [Candidatus Moranbacteria bacterium]|nr:leucine--tRNA ligase [Candidatus Moranbacteria bacterium]
MLYHHKKIEAKWQKKWRQSKIYSPDLDKAGRPYYNLMMFPYPSAEGLHVGNMYAFVHSDCWGRFKRLRGYDVFEPIGLDGFGIHSENYAMKINQHIRDVSKRTEKRFYSQLRLIGNQYDWSRTVETYKPNYYKWTQWLFLQMYNKGLAYRKKSPVNWCGSCKTVLADEQVINGHCERCDQEVEQKQMKQWFFKITQYAERLLNNLKATDPEKKMDWSEDVKLGQINWIGKSQGAQIDFKIKEKEQQITVFTTRPDTIFGASYLVLAPEHELIKKLEKDIENIKAVKTYIQEIKSKEEQERLKQNRTKTGLEIKGIKAINPVNNQEIPIWIADYVLTSYGSGAIMAVPAHDERDFEFAQKYELPIVQVVKPLKNNQEQKKQANKLVCFTDQGLAVNSSFLNGLKTAEAKEKIIKYLEDKSIGRKAVTYKLRDWCVSRQRYWGPPIPIIYCENCGEVPVPEQDLPVKLPELDDFHPDGTGKGPLNKVEEFVRVPCPVCGKKAKRETDVSDPFVDSSWYFFRYLSTENQKQALDKNRIKKWMPIDMYLGGKEHTVLHLLYSRFITMVLHDLGFCDFEEPYKKFFGHGLLIKDGAKMSKSKGNVINPDEYIHRYGADSVRLYLMFLGEVSQGGDWRDSGMAGMFRFVKKLHSLYAEFSKSRIKSKFESSKKDCESIQKIKSPRLHELIKKITDDLNRLSFNTAIAGIMELFNWYKDQGMKELQESEKEAVLEVLAILISPMAPHLGEEFWQMLNRQTSVFNQKWPKYNQAALEKQQIELVIQINGKLRASIKAEPDINSKQAWEKAQKIDKIKKYLDNKKIKKKIFVPGKLLNIVI